MIDHKTLKSFDKLYEDSYRSVLKYVICNCSNLEDVKDIIQNVYFEVLKNYEKEIEINNVNSYIIGIARNKVKEYYRFKYKEKIVSFFSKKDDLELIDNVPSDLDVQKDFLKKEDLKDIWKFLKKKNILISRIFYLYYYDDMSIKEISKELNVSESNVKNHLYRTLKELRIVLEGKGEKNV